MALEDEKLGEWLIEMFHQVCRSVSGKPRVLSKLDSLSSP